MLVSKNSALPMKHAEEAALRRANPEVGVAATAYRVLPALLGPEWLARRGVVRALDVGARDGNTTAALAAVIDELAPGTTTMTGVDPSTDAIAQAEASHPSIAWINDLPGEWFDSPEAKQLAGTFDIVIDRGYPSLLSTPDQAEREARGLQALLAPEGILVQIVARDAYAEWSHLVCLGWIVSLFEIRERVLGRGVRLDDAACYVSVYGIPPRAIAAQPESLPGEVAIRELHFELSDGTELDWYLLGNEGMQMRAWHHAARAGLLPPYRMRISPGASESARTTQQRLLERARSTWKNGNPTVLDPGGAVIGTQGRRVSYQAALYDHLSGLGFNALHYPAACPDARGYLAGISHWVAAQPELVVLGPGLIDARNNPELDGRVVTDVDQFRYVLGWVIERLQEEAGATVVWIDFEPPPAAWLEGGSLRRQDILDFAVVGREVASRRDVPVHEIPFDRIAPDGQPEAARAAAQVLTALSQVSEQRLSGRR